MKPGLGVLPLEVWADIFLSPWFTRQELAQILNKTRNRNFANKLNKLLHDCGKPTLGHLNIYSMFMEIENKLKLQAVLGVGWLECEFPQCEMPENIKGFKQLTINHFDDQVLDFLDKLKPLFTNVILKMISAKPATDMRIFWAHFLPMLTSIRRILCDNGKFTFDNLMSSNKSETSNMATKMLIKAELDELRASNRILDAKLAKQKNKIKRLETQILFSELQQTQPRNKVNDLPVDEEEDENNPCCSKAIKK